MTTFIEIQQEFGRCCRANDGMSCIFTRTLNDGTRKMIANRLNQYAAQLDWNRVIGLVDVSKRHDATAGILVCDTKAYFYGGRNKPQKVWYDEVSRIAILRTEEGFDYGVKFELDSNADYLWKCDVVDCEAITKLIKSIKRINRAAAEEYSRVNLEYENEAAGIEVGGLTVGSRGVVNKVYDEERFHARQGHGFAAERANNLEDRLHGKKATIEGDNNVKNGPDRAIHQPDGAKVLIQSKYCATGRTSINGCFENGGSGEFRYFDSNGKPMVIEVASDTIEDARKAMAGKIENGQVKGVTDPEKAKEIVQPGHFTYQQAKNIAKAGNLDSIIYDAKSGVVISLSAFGVSASITLAISIWNGEEPTVALKNAAFSGIKIGGTTLVTTVLASQIAKSSISGAMTPSFQALAKTLSPKAYAALANAFRSGTTLTGGAAINSAAKLLKGNAITAVVTTAVLTSFDVKDIVLGRISGAQLAVNFAKTTTTVVGGTAGWLGGSTVGTMVLPGVGTVVGGLVGSLVAGGGLGVLIDKATGKFFDSDTDKMIRLIQAAFRDVSEEYLLSQDEAEKISDKLVAKINEKALKKMHSSKDRYWHARGIIEPLANEQVKIRPRIAAPSEDLMEESIDSVVMDIALELGGSGLDE